ncbi:MAG: VCBS repeat-containing protein [Planctomycetaceae bacterium]|nr:VCBS repeat-containing protein [Planctomycetaceae bacterium]
MTHDQSDAGTRSRLSLRIALTLGLVAVAGVIVWCLQPAAKVQAERRLEQARRLREAEQYDNAERLAAEALDLDPGLAEAAFVAANSAAPLGRFEPALQYLDRLQTDDRRLKFSAAFLRGRLNADGLKHIGAAEQAFRDAIAIMPDDLPANEELAELLAATGRRREAIPHVLQLIRHGQETELLVLLSREGGGLDRREWLESGRAAYPEDPVPLLGLAWQAAAVDDHSLAVTLLRSALGLRPDFSAAQIALGESLLAEEKFDPLIEWERSLSSEASDSGEVWSIRGAMCEHKGDSSGAIRCYWEASRRIPELLEPCVRLPSLLKSAGLNAESDLYTARLEALLHLRSTQDRVLAGSRHASVAPAMELAAACEQVGRVYEAYLWARIAAASNPQYPGALSTAQRLEQAVAALPLQLTAPVANIAKTLDLSRFAVPNFSAGDFSLESRHEEQFAPVTFRDRAAEVGLEFQYFNGVEGPTQRKMYEFTGGGVGVLDFDRDGWSDLMFTQGCDWPPGKPDSRHTDQLFRSSAGRKLNGITGRAGIVESDFGQGVAVGDFNADGFPDLFVANIGANRLWRNNGDGTFTDETAEALLAGSRWSTSCLCADLDGDALPDIYEVNYLTGDDLYERVCEHPQGGEIACLPIHFDSALDGLWRNDGDGTFADATSQLLSVPPDGKGLGVAAWDSTGAGRLSLLVANDTTPNLFYVPEPAESGTLQFAECGLSSGLAVNRDGKPEGCMGIALGDVDGDDRLDVYVTNFLGESNTLWTAVAPGLFEDATRNWGLREPTLNQLGFGTQLLDADRDGRLELFVANGHVDDLTAYGKPFAMPPQMFRFGRSTAHEAAAAEIGPFFEREWLGRAAARLDWNRDGLDDLVVGHLHANVALLENSSPDVGPALNLQLIGVDSDRDATGTTIVVRGSVRSITRQLTAGGSYQSASERRLIIPVGQLGSIAEITVRWPSGKSQVFAPPAIDREWLIVEGAAAPLPLESIP